MTGGSDAALTQLRALLANIDVTVATRLPPERRLVEMLGLNRPALRKALAVLEAGGRSGAMSERARSSGRAR
jgi:DNA-binding FadR family transcriptional regulator